MKINELKIVENKFFNVLNEGDKYDSDTARNHIMMLLVALQELNSRYAELESEAWDLRLECNQT